MSQIGLNRLTENSYDGMDSIILRWKKCIEILIETVLKSTRECMFSELTALVRFDRVKTLSFIAIFLSLLELPR